MTPGSWRDCRKSARRPSKQHRSFLAALPIMCVYPFLQKYYIKGIVVGSVKG